MTSKSNTFSLDLTAWISLKRVEVECINTYEYQVMKDKYTLRQKSTKLGSYFCQCQYKTSVTLMQTGPTSYIRTQNSYLAGADLLA